MKTILIQPLGSNPCKVPPLGLGYVAAVLKRKGFDVKIFDLNVKNSSLEDILYLHRPDIVGIKFSCKYPSRI